MSNSQRAVAQRRQREVRTPTHIARAKVGNGWQSIGAAWELRNGEGYSVRLNTLPLNWEGQFVLLPPLENGENDDHQEPE